MPDFALLLSPIVWLMEWVLAAYVSLTGSAGISIMLLAVTFSLLLWPLQRLGLRAERKHAVKAAAVGAEVSAKRREGLKGEQLFDVTEAIYKRHGYHPIQALMGAAGFLVALPVLISSVIVFHQSALTRGQPFLFIADLGEPDAALDLLGYAVNVLPFIMFAVTMTDALLRYRDLAEARTRFLLISSVLLVLVYAMPAGLVLYWTVNNLMALLLARLAATRKPAAAL